jgi:nicotinamide-nucleotide amidase
MARRIIPSTEEGRRRGGTGVGAMAGGVTIETIAETLRARNLTVAVAESCTGGMLGAVLTSVSGSSTYFQGGVIAYADAVKTRELGVSSEALERNGAVSEATARQMACGVRARFATDIGLAITGIAGPGGGTEAKPVGTVYVAAALFNGTRVRACRFAGGRSAVREQSCAAALSLLEEALTSGTARRSAGFQPARKRNEQE